MTESPAGRRVRLSHEGGITRLTLVRPEAGNAIDLEFVHEARAAVATACASPGTRVLLVDAEGRDFTVGGDLAHLAAGRHRLPELLDDMLRPWQDEVLPQLEQAPFPVVTAVQGAAAGGGLGLVYAADLVLAADDARFVTGFTELGLSGDGGSSWHLPRLVGQRRARQMLIGGRHVDAATALDWGLVSEVVPAPELPAAAHRAAERLARSSPLAVAHLRELLRRADRRTLAEHLVAERVAMRSCAADGEFDEGLTAFLAKRRPGFGPARPAAAGAAR